MEEDSRLIPLAKSDGARVSKVPRGEGYDLLVWYPRAFKDPPDGAAGRKQITLPVVVELRNVREASGTLLCDIRVVLVLKDTATTRDARRIMEDKQQTTETTLIHSGQIKLGDLQARRMLAHYLVERGIISDAATGEQHWHDRLQSLYNIAQKECLSPMQRPILLRPFTGDDRTLVFIPGLMPRSETTLLYGKGGSAKSLTALVIALGAAGLPVNTPGLTYPVKAKTLYLDFETSNQIEHEKRLAWLLRGFGLPVDAYKGSIYWLPLYGSLLNQIQTVVEHVQELQTELIIIDSAALASAGGIESSEAAVQITGALRNLKNTTRLLIAHVTKAGAKETDRGGQAQPFGSAFWRNSVRSSIEVGVLEQVQDRLTIKFRQDKFNMGSTSPEFAWDYAWDSAAESISISHATPALMEGTFQNFIWNHLPDAPQFRPVKDILVYLKESMFESRTELDVRSVLNELHHKGFATKRWTEAERHGRPQEWAKRLPDEEVEF